jgi:hypothetical protein
MPSRCRNGQTVEKGIRDDIASTPVGALYDLVGPLPRAVAPLVGSAVPLDVDQASGTPPALSLGGVLCTKAAPG